MTMFTFLRQARKGHGRARNRICHRGPSTWSLANLADCMGRRNCHFMFPGIVYVPVVGNVAKAGQNLWKFVARIDEPFRASVLTGPRLEAEMKC